MVGRGDANVGLLDQRLTPSRVIVMGESAGGGSAASQITAFRGESEPVSFQQAIFQSQDREMGNPLLKLHALPMTIAQTRIDVQHNYTHQDLGLDDDAED